jgi:hypothetical protein
MPILTDDFKKDLFVDIANMIINGLNEGVLMNEDAHNASNFILEKLNPIADMDEFAICLDEFVTTWPYFKPILEKIKAQQAQTEDQQKMAEIQNKLQSLITVPN